MWRVEEMDAPDREDWEIVLPNDAGTWHTTQPESGSNRWWDVTGEPPNITVHPSINATGPDGERGPGSWHGWIVDGEMTP